MAVAMHDCHTNMEKHVLRIRLLGDTLGKPNLHLHIKLTSLTVIMDARRSDDSPPQRHHSNSREQE